jgi:hypothetical protein
MDPIHVPEPVMTDDQRISIATELAFDSLLHSARRSGLSIGPVMGLMYLPSQEATRQFQEACRAVLSLLTNHPVE